MQIGTQRTPLPWRATVDGEPRHLSWPPRIAEGTARTIGWNELAAEAGDGLDCICDQVTGTVFHRAGEQFERRSLPDYYLRTGRRIEVRPHPADPGFIRVERGTAAPWFERPGGARVFTFTDRSCGQFLTVRELVEAGVFAVPGVDPMSGTPGDPGPGLPDGDPQLGDVVRELAHATGWTYGQASPGALVMYSTEYFGAISIRYSAGRDSILVATVDDRREHRLRAVFGSMTDAEYYLAWLFAGHRLQRDWLPLLTGLTLHPNRDRLLPKGFTIEADQRQAHRGMTPQAVRFDGELKALCYGLVPAYPYACFRALPLDDVVTAIGELHGSDALPVALG